MAKKQKGQINHIREIIKTYINNKDVYCIQKKACGSAVSEWEDTDENDIDVINYDYQLRKIENKTIKKIPFTLKIWKSGNRIYTDAHTFSMLRENERLYVKCKNAHMHYFDPLTWEKTEEYKEDINEIDDISFEDENSLRVVYRFISSIASGVRRPSDKDNAIEAKKYLKKFLEKNYIKVN